MKLDKKRLSHLSDLQLKIQKGKVEIAELYMNIELINRDIKSKMHEVRSSQSEITQLLNELEEEFGSVNINLSTGEMTKNESKPA